MDRIRTNLYLRGKIYYCRLYIPKPYQKVMRKTEIWQSLNTSNVHEAKIKLLEAINTLMFKMNLTEHTSIKLDNDTLKLIAARYISYWRYGLAKTYSRELRLSLNNEYDPTVNQSPESNLKDYLSDFYIQDYIDSDPMVKIMTYLEEEEISFNDTFAQKLLSYMQTNEVFDELLVISSNEIITGYQRIIQEYVSLNELINPNKTTAIIPPNNVSNLDSSPYMTFSELRKRYEEDIHFSGKTGHMHKAYDAGMKVLSALIAKELDVRTINRIYLSNLFNDLACYPSRGASRFPTLSVQQRIQKAKDDTSIKRIAIKTYNDRVAILKSIIEFGKDNKIIESDVLTLFKNVKRKDAVAAIDKKSPFSYEQLNKLFSLDKFKGYKTSKYYDTYWCCLLALFASLRLNEAYTLRLSDIITHADGIHYISINKDHPFKTLKQPHSRRLIPVSNIMLQLGFMNFIEALRSETSTPDMPLFNLVGEKPSDKFGKRVNYFLKKNLALTDKQSFHSFRHNFKDFIRNTPNVNSSEANSIGGWKTPGVSENYGSTALLSTKKTIIDSLNYEGINIQGLYTE